MGVTVLLATVFTFELAQGKKKYFSIKNTTTGFQTRALKFRQERGQRRGGNKVSITRGDGLKHCQLKKERNECWGE